jgi:GcrA cell cycle regulator
VGWAGAKAWSEADDALLKEMAAAGYSASIIGDQLGRTRNSVIGRVGRLTDVKLKKKQPGEAGTKPKINPLAKNKMRDPITGTYRATKPRRPVHGPRTAQQKSWATGGLPQSSAPKKPWVEPPNFDTGTKTLVDLKFVGECHWPVGDPKQPGFLYCGRPVIDEKTGEVDVAREPHYCTGHYRRAHAQRA